jgi:hypothetical protein
MADDLLTPQGPSVDGTEVMVWHQPSGKMLPLWTARSLDKAALNDAAYPSSPPFGVHPDAVADAAVDNNEMTRVAEAKEREAMHLDPLPDEPSQGGDCGDDCGDDCHESGNEPEKRDDGKLAKARGLAAKRDEGERSEPEEPPREEASEDEDVPEDGDLDDPEEPDDPEEAALQRILGELSRLDERMSALEASRAARLKLDRLVDAEIERQRDQMPPSAEKPLPPLPN